MKNNTFTLAEVIFDNLATDYHDGHIDTMYELEAQKEIYIKEAAYNNSDNTEEEDTIFAEITEIVEDLIIHSNLNNIPLVSEIDNPNIDYGRTT